MFESLSPSVTGGILGAITGAIFGFGGTWIHDYRRTRREKTRLKRAIASEIQYMYDFFEDLDDEDSEIPTKAIDSTISTSIYEDNASNIGLLKPSVSEQLIEFYSHAYKLKYMISKVDELEERDELSGEENTKKEALEGLISGLAPEFRRLRDETLRKLGHEPFNSDENGGSGGSNGNNELKDSMIQANRWIIAGSTAVIVSSLLRSPFQFSRMSIIIISIFIIGTLWDFIVKYIVQRWGRNSPSQT
ncbi:hypothetical protein [Halorussus halobius]|uniref:hypothetical protein n=1 Tax=Halorussus halobius TaxID=1710537 RepID=UPI001091CD36|nr:hypothetical protein [Halorussus halobius]